MEPIFEVNDEVSQNELSGIWTKGKVWEAQNMFYLTKVEICETKWRYRTRKYTEKWKMVGLNMWMGRLEEVVRISTLSWWNNRKTNIVEWWDVRSKFKVAYVEYVSSLTVKQKEPKTPL